MCRQDLLLQTRSQHLKARLTYPHIQVRWVMSLVMQVTSQAPDLCYISGKVNVISIHYILPATLLW